MLRRLKKDDTRQRLGELLQEYGLINSNQLKDALRRQAQVEGQIGSILLDMGYISTDDLLDFLSKQLGVPSVNLLSVDIDPKVVKLIPSDKIKKMKILPIGVDQTSITLAMVNPRDVVGLNEIEFLLGRKIKPVVVPSAQMDATIRSLDSHPGEVVSGEMIGKELLRTEKRKPPDIRSLLQLFSSSAAPDMLLSAGAPPSIKLRNNIVREQMMPSPRLTVKAMQGS